MAVVSELSTEKINQAGIDLIDNAEKMYSSLKEVKALIEGSKSYFDSSAGDQMRNKFNESAAKFEEFKSYLTDYGEYLKTFAGNVVSYENAVMDAIGDMVSI